MNDGVFYKYHKGDSVYIIPDFDKHRYEDDPSIDPIMLKYAGRYATVKFCTSWKQKAMYNMEEFDWTWDERWLEPVRNININTEEITSIFKE